jgi:hypothetical protein
VQRNSHTSRLGGDERIYSANSHVYAHTAELVWKLNKPLASIFLEQLVFFFDFGPLGCVIIELRYTWIAELSKNILYPSPLKEARGSPKAGRNGQGEQSQTVNSSSNLQ